MCTVCVLLLLWPSRLFCGVLVVGFLHISVAMVVQIILWVLVYFCCCGPPDHCVGFLCIFVAVTLQSILGVLVYFCCCGPPDHCVRFLCISVAVTLQIIL